MRSATSQRMMIIKVERGALTERWLRPINEMQHPAHRFGEDGLVQRPVAYGGDDRRIADSAVGRHLKIKTTLQCRNPIMYRTPVRHHEALEIPLFAQYLGQQPVVL